MGPFPSTIEEDLRGDEDPGCRDAQETTRLVVSDGHVRPPPRLSSTRQALLLAILSCSGLLNLFTAQSVVILLPTIGDALSIPFNRRQLVTSVYSIAFGSVILLWGRVADVRGRRPVFLAGFALFTGVSVAIPFARDELTFHALRALQGLANAATVPSALGIVAVTFPPGPRRRRAYVSLTAASAVGSVLGNLAGGVIGVLLSWHWVFWIPAVMSGLATAAANVLLPSLHDVSLFPARPETDQESFVDWFGGFLISSCLMLLLVSLTEANVLGWSAPYVLYGAIASVILGVAFIRWQILMERKSGCQPLIRLSWFERAELSAAVAVIGLFLASYTGYLVFASIFYQDFLGLDMLQTTIRFIPAGAIGFLSCFAVAPALSAFRGFHNLLVGLVCGILSPLLFAQPVIPPTAPYWAFGLPAMCLCFSADLVWPVVALSVARNVPEADQSLAGGLLMTVNQVGRALGLTIATGVQTYVQGTSMGGGTPSDADILRGVRAAQWTNVGMASAALIVAVRYLRGLE